MSESQGCKANGTGKQLERLVREILHMNGLPFTWQYELGVLSVMKKKVRVDFYIPRVVGYENGLIVQCKWQGSSGSVDEKTPGLVQDIKTRYGKETIVVVGGAYSDSTRDHLRENIGGNLLAVMGLSEFLAWAQEASVGRGENYIERTFDPDQKLLFTVD